MRRGNAGRAEAPRRGRLGMMSGWLGWPGVWFGLLVLGAGAGGAVGGVGVVRAQQPAEDPPSASAPPRVVDTDMAAVLARHYRALTAESVRALAPGQAVDAITQYVATQFQQLGLSPAGKDGTWFQHYLLPGQRSIDPALSPGYLVREVLGPKQPVINERGTAVVRKAKINFTTDAYYLGPATAGPWVSAGQRTVLVTGPQTAASVGTLDLREAVAVYVPSAGLAPAARQQALAALQAATPWVLVADDGDSASFAAAVAAAQQHPPQYVEEYLAQTARERSWPWTVVIRESVLTRLLAGAADLAAARHATTPAAQELPGVQMGMSGVPAPAGPALVTAPNVVGRLPSPDPTRQHQYVLITARLPGSWPASPNDTDNDAPDRALTHVSAGDSARAAAGIDIAAVNAAGLLALATAFAERRAQLHRSVIIAAVSGSVAAEGSRALLQNGLAMYEAAPFHLDIDLAGYGASEGAVTVYGASDVTLAPPVAWVAAAHPELQVDVVDSGTAVRPVLDGLVFVCRGIPSLYFAFGRPFRDGSGPPTPASVAAFVSAPLGQLLRLIVFVAEAGISGEQPVGWSAAGRRALASCGDAP